MIVHVACLRMPLLGAVQVAATAYAVVEVRLDDDRQALEASIGRRFPEATIRRGNAITAEAVRAIRRYLEGGPDPDLEFVLPEVGFPTRVWRKVRRIPRGEVRSYGRIAQAVARPGAARAVGQACGRNPLPLLVPCHRVVASDGSLGGFGAGREAKRRLLRLEGALVRG